MTLNFDQSKLVVILSTLKAYDDTLKENDINVGGTRLHAGIRALNYKCRFIIVSIDNRAKEIHRSTNLFIGEKSRNNDLGGINSLLVTDIKLLTENIMK